MLGRRRRTPPTGATLPVIAGYTDLRFIGSGGFSRVYTARQEQFSRTVAVKVITAELSDDARRRFRREQASAGSLDGHPQVIRVYESGVTDAGQPYLTMEYHEAGSLADRLRREGPLPVADVLSIGVKLACALDAAHRRGIVHRDVKPQNVLTSPFVGPILADFGIAAVDDVRLSTVTGEAFSALHVAPEVLDGLPATPSADLYSLASTLYELLAGRAPFAGDHDDGLLGLMRRVRLGGVPPIERADVPAPVAETLHDLLERPVPERPESGMALAALLRELEAGLGLEPTPLVADPRRAPAAAAGGGVAAPAAALVATVDPRPASPAGGDGGTGGTGDAPVGEAVGPAGPAAAGDPPPPPSPATVAPGAPPAWPGAEAGDPGASAGPDGDGAGGADVRPAGLVATVTRASRRRRAEAPAGAPDERSRRPLVAAAVLVAALVGTVAFVVTRPGGDGGDEAAGSTTTAPSTTATTAPATTPTSAPATTPTTAPPAEGGTVVPAPDGDWHRQCDPIEAAGLGCEIVEEAATSPNPPKAVLRQVPAAGTTVAPGSTVTLYRDANSVTQLVAVTPPGGGTVLTVNGPAAADLAAQGWGRQSLGTIFTEQAPETEPLYCFQATAGAPTQGYAYVLDSDQLHDPSWYEPCEGIEVMGYVYPGAHHGDSAVYVFRSAEGSFYSNNVSDPRGLSFGPAELMFTIWQ